MGTARKGNMPYQPTPEQFAELDALKSFQERENLIALWEEEAKAFAPPEQPEGKVETAKVDERQVDAVQPAADQPAVETAIATPTNQQVANEDAVKGVDYYLNLARQREEEAAKWEKRKSDGDRYIKQLEQDRLAIQKERDAIVLKIDSLEQLVKTLSENKIVQQEPEDEIDTSYPEISQKIRKSNAALEARLRRENEERLRVIEERNKRIEAEAEERNKQLAVQTHYMQVKTLHPDVDDFLSPTKLGPALVEWANTQPSIFANIVSNPIAYKAEDVAYVLSQFKTQTGYQAVKKPSLGDLATKVTASTRVKEADSEPAVFPSNFTEKDLDKLLNKINNEYKGKPRKEYEAAIDDVLAKYEQTIMKRNRT